MTVEELEIWYKNVKLPEGPIQLYPGTTIVGLPLFLESHFNTLKKNPGSRNSKPSYDRLIDLKKILEKEKPAN